MGIPTIMSSVRCVWSIDISFCVLIGQGMAKNKARFTYVRTRTYAEGYPRTYYVICTLIHVVRIRTCARDQLTVGRDISSIGQCAIRNLASGIRREIREISWLWFQLAGKLFF